MFVYFYIWYLYLAMFVYFHIWYLYLAMFVYFQILYLYLAMFVYFQIWYLYLAIKDCISQLLLTADKAKGCGSDLLFVFIQLSPNRRNLFRSHWSTDHRQKGKFLNIITAEKSILSSPQINIWSRNRYDLPLAENTFITFNKWCCWLSSISVRKAVCVYLSKSCFFHLLSKIYLSRLLSLYLWQMHLWVFGRAGPSNGSPPDRARCPMLVPYSAIYVDIVCGMTGPLL